MKARVRSFTTISMLVVSLGVLVMMSNSRAQQSQYQTVGPGKCGIGQGSCHATENEWWEGDTHYATFENIYDDEDSYKQMADRYAQRVKGATVNSGNFLRGDQVCMGCHATVVSANASSEVEDGVSCESCHGAGSGYQKSHQKDNGGGYEKGVADGLAPLKTADGLAKACVECHYITDPRLVNDAVGHPDGASFKYGSKMKQVAKHWKNRKWTSADVKSSKQNFTAAKNAKKGASNGFADQVVRVSKTTAPQRATPASDSQPSSQQQVVRSTSQSSSAPTAPARPRRTGRARPTNPQPVRLGPIDLPAFPVVADSATTEQLMLLIKKRLELLYSKTSKR